MKTSNDRILVLVESPNKVKSIKQFLPPNYVVMASVGHISEIKDGGSYYNTGIEPNDNFKTNYVVSSDKKDIVAQLKKQVELADFVYICSDPDREGEAIAWSLKKFLKIPKDKYKRATFHEITKTAVLKALANPRDIDDNLVEAAQSRQQLDKLLGYRLSRIAQKVLSAKSVGRCQSAGLKIIVDREMEIMNFKPETYYDISLYFEKYKNIYKAKYVGTIDKDIKRIKTFEEAQKIIDETRNKQYKISDIQLKEKTNSPKPPFITSTFQQEVSSKLGISVKSAMMYAQKLFEGIDVNGEHKALITYIRTDSTELAPEFVTALKDYVINTYGKEYYAPIRKSKKKENVQDGHEAIRPVDLNMTPETLSLYISDYNLIRVYDIIYKRTVASMMANAITSETTYTILNGNHRFQYSSNELIFDGYKKVYMFKDDEDTLELTKDVFELNEVLMKPSLESVEKQTTPPARYKEATFIKELESTGIGRPSTFAFIINTLLDQSRGYCILNDSKQIVPTEKGIELSKFLDESFSDLINLKYTSELEKSLDSIAKGNERRISFLMRFYTKMEESIKSSSKLQNLLKSEPRTADCKCPECGSEMYIRKGPFGEFYGCSKYPRCRGTASIK